MKFNLFWEADGGLVGQGILVFYGTRSFYYRVHNSSPLDPTLRQFNPVYILTPNLFKIHFNIILDDYNFWL
jgi:hypothetical protein